MVSTWWLLVAFFGGAWAGVLVMALMSIAGQSDELRQATREQLARYATLMKQAGIKLE